MWGTACINCIIRKFLDILEPTITSYGYIFVFWLIASHFNGQNFLEVLELIITSYDYICCILIGCRLHQRKEVSRNFILNKMCVFSAQVSCAQDFNKKINRLKIFACKKIECSVIGASGRISYLSWYKGLYQKQVTGSMWKGMYVSWWGIYCFLVVFLLFSNHASFLVSFQSSLSFEYSKPVLFKDYTTWLIYHK